MQYNMMMIILLFLKMNSISYLVNTLFIFHKRMKVMAHVGHLVMSAM